MLSQAINELCSLPSEHVVLVGDFNFPSIDWKNFTTRTSESSKETHFIETLRDNFLIQHLEYPTRARKESNPSLLDLIISHDDYSIPNCSR